MGEHQPEHLVLGPRLEERAEHRHVRLRAGVRLHVGVVGAEQLLRAIDRELLGDVDEPAAAVVAVTRVPLGVLVVHRRGLRGEHRGARVVLRGDQPQRAPFALELARDRIGDLRVGGAQRVPVRDEPVARVGVVGHLSVLLVRSRRPVAAVARAARPRTACRATAGGSPGRAGRRRSGRPSRARSRRCAGGRAPRGAGRCRAPRGRPCTLLAASCSPCPDPPSTIPRSARPSTTARAAAAQKSG